MRSVSVGPCGMRAIFSSAPAPWIRSATLLPLDDDEEEEGEEEEKAPASSADTFWPPGASSIKCVTLSNPATWV